MQGILLTQDLVALVDDEDFERLSGYRWHARRNRHIFYAQRSSPRPNRYIIHMHHEVMGVRPPDGYRFDHRDGNGLNNQKSNLRLVTRSQNNMNQRCTVGTSNLKGVCWSLSHNKWQASIQSDGERKFLGYFESEEDAGRAYDVAALKYFGEYARFNFAGR